MGNLLVEAYHIEIGHSVFQAMAECSESFPFSSSIPPLEKDGIVYSDETDKANLLNDLF